MIPLFVADRPASLRILSQIDPSKHEFGILSHPYTTDNFKKQFEEFKCSLKICDSGIYQGDQFRYDQLFKEYKRMGADYGIIKDYYRDRRKTRESASIGFRIFRTLGYDKFFNLIGVAQGNSVADYLQSYAEQKEFGFQVVAIGGLLDKMPPTVKIAKVRSRSDLFIRNVIEAIRREYPSDKLFPLGVFNKRRLTYFYEQNVWASDYKGWIFRYDIKRSRIYRDRFKQIADYIEREVFPFLKIPDSSIETRKSNRGKHRKRLLIMACGKTKRDSPGRAIDVYLGPSFKLVRKYLKSNNHLDVKIISAKYGIIDYKDRIVPYDLKMNKEYSLVYKQVIKPYLESLRNIYNDAFLIGGRYYQNIIPLDFNMKRAKGRIGEQLSQLKEWLSLTWDS